MAGTRIQPNFRKFAALRNGLAKGSLERHPRNGPEEVDGANQREILTISQYQDPRDQLDQERHTMRARALQDGGEFGDDPPEAA